MHINKTVEEIAKIVDGKIDGDAKLFIKKFSSLAEAQKGDISFLSNKKYVNEAANSKADAIIVDKNIEIHGKTCIKVENSSNAVTVLLTKLHNPINNFYQGIHNTAVIGKTAVLDSNVNIGPYAVIEDNAEIGANSTIASGTYIGRKTKVGSDCLIYPNVVVREECIIGNRVIIHSNTVIGSDGFGYETINGVHKKIPQIGIVVIEDDVEIGANVAVDRARFDKTIIRKGAKIDNLVQIAHNVEIGENCIIIAQTGIAGSTKLGKYVTIAGQAGVGGHLEIADFTTFGAKSGVTKNIKKKGYYSGFPIKEHKEQLRLYASLNRVPELLKRVDELEKLANGQ